MDELRAILIIAGILILALIYFFSRRSQQDQRPADEKTIRKDTEWMEEIAKQRRKLARNSPVPADHPDTPPPLFDAGPAPESEEITKEVSPQQPETATDPVPLEEEQTPPLPEPELIVVLHITAPRDMTFVGATLFSALEEIGLRFGEGGIFHYSRAQQDTGDAPLFSVANILEPGTFVGGQMEQEFTTPGIVMFMRATGAVPAREMVETLLLKAQQLAQLLGGEIRDEAREMLSESTMKTLLDKAIGFDDKTGANSRH